MNEPDSAESVSLPHIKQKRVGLPAALSRPEILCLLLALVTAGVFWPLRHCGFINYDDPKYVTSNHQVLQGFTLKTIAWAFTTGECANWHPLTWLSHMLDVEMFGLNPGGSHLVNLLFHVANTVLLFVLLKRWTGALWRSAFVAALFALHPLHVESVAWISERKDVLSTFFALLTMGAYGRYARRRSKAQSRESRVALADQAAVDGPGLDAAPASDLSSRHSALDSSAPSALDARRSTLDYLLALLFFVLGLMAKPMLVTLPFVLLLLDYWPLDRFGGFGFRISSFRTGSPSEPGTAGSMLEPQNSQPSTLNPRPSTFFRLVLEKIPFFAVSAISCAVTFWVQKHSGAVLTLTSIPFTTRIENAFVSYGRYLGKMVWPSGLALPYPYPTEWPWLWVAGGAILTIGLCAAGWWLGRRWPFLRTGIFWFFGMLVPVIGLVQVGNQSLADRYTYMPLIGMAVVLSWGAGAVAERWRFPSWLQGLVAISILGACAARTEDQLRYWHDSGSLFRHAVAVTKNNGLAYDNLGFYLFNQGRPDEAIECYRVASQISPKDAIACDGVGCCLFKQGRTEEAVSYFQRSLQINPHQASSLFNLGSVFALQQDYGKAAQYFEAARKIEPDDPDVLICLGDVYFLEERYSDALPCYQAAARAAPDSGKACNCLGATLNKLGRLAEAEQQFQRALRLNPNDAYSHAALARILLDQNRRAEAVEHLKATVRLNPADSDARRLLEQLEAPDGK
jgi:protein O-mannosyl-transferase